MSILTTNAAQIKTLLIVHKNVEPSFQIWKKENNISKTVKIQSSAASYAPAKSRETKLMTICTRKF